MKSKYKGKYQRTSGWETQPDYDNILADLDVSSLVFLKNKLYPSRLREFRNTHDLNEPENQKKYKLMQQRVVMIGEELYNRVGNIYASKTYQHQSDRFDNQTGIVLDKYGNVKYGIAFNEDEDDYIYDHTNNTTSHPTLNSKDDEEYTYKKFHTKKGIYEDWNYIKDLDD